MAFTDGEKRAWHEAKRKREVWPETAWRPQPAAQCIHCGLPFGYGEGYISDDVSLCDRCNGD